MDYKKLTLLALTLASKSAKGFLQQTNRGSQSPVKKQQPVTYPSIVTALSTNSNEPSGSRVNLNSKIARSQALAILQKNPAYFNLSRYHQEVISSAFMFASQPEAEKLYDQLLITLDKPNPEIHELIKPYEDNRETHIYNISIKVFIDGNKIGQYVKKSQEQDDNVSKNTSQDQKWDPLTGPWNPDI